MQSASAIEMSDMESDGDGGFTCKPPHWRCEQLTLAVRELDQLTAAQKKSRKYGSPSKQAKK